jgi:von Hippel-Lindau disease tumor supressor
VTTPVIAYGGESCYIEKILLKAPAGLAKEADASCRKEGTLRSADNHHRVTITIKNNQGSTLDLYWIDYAGARQSYGTLESGQSVTQSTFLTHPWIVADHSGKCLKLFVPHGQTTEFAIP